MSLTHSKSQERLR